MSTISPTNINDGDAVTAASVNNQVNTIVNDYNGNITAANLAANSVTTSELTDTNVTAAKMQYGMIRGRRGGSSGDATWLTAGTTNTDTSAKAAFFQAGAVDGNGTGVDVAVTFPNAYTQVPLVFATPQTSGSANCYAIVNSTTISGFNVRLINAPAAERIAWLSVGQ